MKKAMNRFGMIVIDTDALAKMCVVYATDVKGVDFLSAVEECFEDIGVDVDYSDVEKIAKEVFHKGFSNWDTLHFEMLMK